MTNNGKKLSNGLSLLPFLCLFLYGFFDNLRGPTLPLMLQKCQFSYSQGGIIQQGVYFGFLTSTLLTGLLLLRFSHREILYAAIACLLIGVLSYSLLSNFYLLIFSMIISGLGFGFLDLIGIRLIVDFQSAEKGRLLNLSAFFHGLASMLAAPYSGLILSKGFQWEFVYFFSLIPIFFFVIMLILIRIPKSNRRSENTTNGFKRIYQAIKDKKAWPYYALIMFYESIEIGFAVWASEFLQSVKNQPESTSFLYLSLFFLCIMAGRFLGSFIVEKIGYLRMILLAAIGAVICLSLGIFRSEPYIFFLPFTGFFLSIIFPTTTAAASEDLKDSSDMSLSLFFTFAGLGGMIGSWAIGGIADFSNLQYGFTLLILMALFVVAMDLFLIFRKRRTLKISKVARQ